MATTVEVNRSGTWEEISYADFKIETGTSVVQVAPTAEVTTTARESIQAGQDLRITIDGTVTFEGVTQSAGKIRQDGSKRVTVEHDAVTLMEETVDLSLSSPSVVQVLDNTLSNANSGGQFSISIDFSQNNLNNDYAVTDRPVKRVFRDMADRADIVWWVDPAGTTINVETPGARGTWQSLDAQADRFGIVSFGEGSVETVRNDVTVVGTGDVAVTGSASDSTSISTYGSRPGNSPYQVSYVTTQAEADAVAQSLLVPDPLPSGEILAGKNVGDVTQPLSNYTVDLTDVTKGIDATGLVVTKQTIEQGRATLQVGAGAGDAIANVNRRVKSDGDVTSPGSVYPTDRIDESAITTPKLVDTSVVEAKLADLAVSTAKLQNNAVINGKLSDLSVSTTKIQDGSISTPKLVTEAVTANEIEADTITAAQIAAGTITALEIAADEITASEIAAGTITALEIASDTITANQIASMTLSTNELVVGADTDARLEFDAFAVTPDFDGVVMRPGGSGEANLGSSSNDFLNVFASNYNTTSPDPIDGVDCDGLCDVDWYDNPPEPVRKQARAIGETDDEVPEAMDHMPVELGTMANWLLEAAKAQQERINSLEDRLAALEGADGGNA